MSLHFFLKTKILLKKHLQKTFFGGVYELVMSNSRSDFHLRPIQQFGLDLQV